MISYVFFLVAIIIELSLLAQATDLLSGHLGKPGLSAPVFAGTAAYSYAISVTCLQLSPWLAVLISLSIVAFAALSVGQILVKLTAENFLLASFGLQVALVDLARNLKLTGGPLGIRDVPAPKVSYFDGGAAISALLILVPGIIISTIFLRFILAPSCQAGRICHWIRDDQISAVVFGIPIERFVLIGFVAHAIIAAFAGIGFVIAQAYVSPNSFSLWISLNVLAVVYLSGTGGNPIMFILGSFIVVAITELLSLIIEAPNYVGAFQQIVLNVLLLLILIFWRRGIAGPLIESGPSAYQAE